MNEKDVESKWLRIGFSDKLANKTIGKRRRLGEKGVGRLSADRLGSRLQLRSQAKNKPPVGIDVDWSKFEIPGTDLHAIEIATLEHVQLGVPRPSKRKNGTAAFGSRPQSIKSNSTMSGCELVITSLRQNWLIDDIQRLREELGHLINPFDQGGDFQIRVITDLADDLNGVIDPPKFSEGEIEGIFVIKNRRALITVQTADDKQKKARTSVDNMSLESLCNLTPKEQLALADVGDFKIQLRLYSIGKDGLHSSHTRQSVQTFLDANAGVRMYRDGIRVLPYGDPSKAEGDWLGLDKRKAGARAAISRVDWRIESNRITGAVSIGRDSNPRLLDAASREGLISNNDFVTLRKIVLASLRHLERKYQNIRAKPEDLKDLGKKPIEPQRVVRAFSTQFKQLTTNLKQLEKALPKSESTKVAKIRSDIVQQEIRFDELRQGLSAYLDQALTFRGLATLGIAHASFGHEIQISAVQSLSTVRAAMSIMERSPIDLPKTNKELKKAIGYGERISTWGSYTLTRVNANKRSLSQEADVDVAIGQLVEDLKPFFSASSISLEIGRMDNVTTSLVIMDLESLVINFLTNAYDFVKSMPVHPRRVRIDLRAKSLKGIKGFEISVGDTGNGVPKHMREDIWTPLFTTKQDGENKPYGTGLGLTIVDAILKDLGGHRAVETDRDLGGALFTVWIPQN